MPFCVIFFTFLIRDEPPFLRVDQQHPAGAKARFFHDMRRLHREHANFRGKDEPVVISYIISRRTKPVTIKCGACYLPVREDHGRRTVPGFHHSGVIMIEILFLLFHMRIILPGLRYHHHDSKRKRDAVHHEKLKGVVNHSGIRACLVDDRKGLPRILFKLLTVKSLFTGYHPVIVSPDGIDLTVMGYEPVRMRPLPGRSGIRGETRMNYCYGTLVFFALKIKIEPAELSYKEHPLIDYGPRGQGADICIIGALLKFPPKDIKPLVEGKALLFISRTLNKALVDRRHT